MLLLAACTTSGEPTDSAPEGTGRYEVRWSATPTPITAGSPSEFELTVEGPDGRPVADLQASHGRYVHTVFVSEDLQSFQHLHMEDVEAVGDPELEAATFRFPLTEASAGRSRVAFDYAHENQYLQNLDWVDVTGSPSQLEAPVEDNSAERTVDDLKASAEWTVPPIAGFDAAFVLHLEDLDGNDVTDVVQWHESDAYIVVAAWDLSTISHTHAWVPGMENAAPGAETPHLYPGPDIEVHAVFPYAGRYQMWVQLARAGAPDAPYTIPFQFEVSG